MATQGTLSSFFKKKAIHDFHPSQPTPMPQASEVSPQASKPDERPLKCRRIQPEEMDAINIERDPGLRPMIWEFPLNQRDEIQRAYLKIGPYQPRNIEYPFSRDGNRNRRFQASWFDAHSCWLEYSPKNDAIYCLPCYLFGKKDSGRANAFIVDGFKKWKKVNDGANCPLLKHVGKNPIHHTKWPYNLVKISRINLNISKCYLEKKHQKKWKIADCSLRQQLIAMKLVKTRLWNKMEDDFLVDTLTICIEKDIAKPSTTEEIMEVFIKSRIEEHQYLDG